MDIYGYMMYGCLYKMMLSHEGLDVCDLTLKVRICEMISLHM